MRVVASVASSLSMLLSAGVVHAADIVRPPVVAPPPVIVQPAAFSWRGCYVGVIGGYGWGNSHWIDPVIGEFSHDQPAGWLAGGEVGCNLTAGALVLGVEGDLAWANFTDSRHHVTGDPDDWTDTTKYHGIGSIAGRIGFARDRTLFYAKAGWAMARVTLDDTGFNPTNPLPAGYHYAATENRSGYLLGLGVERALPGNWTIKVEYNYMNFGTKTVTLNGIVPKPGQPTETVISRLDQSVVKVGLNFRF
jgi:outer membrane immunogenic protein